MKKIITTLLLSTLLISCEERHFLNDVNYRQKVHELYTQRQEEASGREEALFSVFNNKKLTLEEREALEFLYAYMPLCDLAEYDGDFFLQQVQVAFKTRKTFSWGNAIPENLFRHFVLVYRVNNEYLDTSRVAFFEELKDRVKHLSMAEAALEVNHWCHEKVTYRGTDARTSAPLALVKTAWGRCGEESTFTVAALRAVGIPARQCYTPRWVHTDDNHAWVEVWINGKWHYMGACEPEPELDVAWFTGPAKRAMMVHTKVFGHYTGLEEKNLETPLYSIINLTSNYTHTRKVNVLVLDTENQPVEGARVQFKVYNYAELYPISSNVTNKRGETSIISGMGDLVVWADKDGVYGYQKSEPTDSLTVVRLDRMGGDVYSEDYIINVPPAQSVTEVSPEKIAANVVRLTREDSIRNAYMTTFATHATAYKLAEETNLDRVDVWKYLQLSQGNWEEISEFLRTAKQNPYLFPFLASLRAKDLRDTPAAFLRNHLEDSTIITHVASNLIAPYILSPRIGNELITPWRGYFDVDSALTAKQIIDYIQENIWINDADNYYNCMITPRGAYELGIADKRSRNILFVAMCRDNNIPARIETATAKPQYYAAGQWIDVFFDPAEGAQANLPQARLTLTNNVFGNIVKPGYESHFTLAVFKNGDFQTLNYEGNALLAKFPAHLALDEGYYRLMVGSRANDGAVFVHTEYFELNPDNAPHTIRITLPKVTSRLFVKGIVDMNSIVVLNGGKKTTLKDLSHDKGLMLCFVDPSKEPSKHILQDLPAVQTALEEWGGGVLLMIPSDKQSDTFDASVFNGLPAQTAWASDADRALLKATTSALQMEFGDNFPLTVYLTRTGGIIYSYEGYRIGTGEDILKTIRQEQESYKGK
ncbi:transglutaminase [Bacteroidia bacterium]|nr:transglutaminase [Bacteroidia bacterium]